MIRPDLTIATRPSHNSIFPNHVRLKKIHFQTRERVPLDWAISTGNQGVDAYPARRTARRSAYSTFSRPADRDCPCNDARWERPRRRVLRGATAEGPIPFRSADQPQRVRVIRLTGWRVPPPEKFVTLPIRVTLPVRCD